MRETRPINRSPGRARSHMRTKPLSAALQMPFPLKARDSHTSSSVCPRLGKKERDGDPCCGVDCEAPAASSVSEGEGRGSEAAEEQRTACSHGRTARLRAAQPGTTTITLIKLEALAIDVYWLHKR